MPLNSRDQLRHYGIPPRKPYNEAVASLDIPVRIKALPIDSRGFPVPWFVAWIDGAPDFRVVDAHKVEVAVRSKRCFICGGAMGRYLCFAIGPMCTVNRVSAEPPSHLECCQFAVKACPFLVNPRMRRNDKDVPEDHSKPAGVMLARNPGVTALWVTKSYELMGNFRQGVLFGIGPPEAVSWYAQGRAATRAEVEQSIESGLPALREQCDLEETIDRRHAAHRQLGIQLHIARRFLPTEQEAAE